MKDVNYKKIQKDCDEFVERLKALKDLDVEEGSKYVLKCFTDLFGGVGDELKKYFKKE